VAASLVRVLFLADSHLGFDLPARPRVDRPRRGHDFFANYERALELALEQPVHALVHGGDVFYRSRIPEALVQQAFVPLKRVAERGIPVVVVPGNHERSRIPHDMLALHPRIHVFDRPRTFTLRLDGTDVAFGGFPFCRRDVRSGFRTLLGQTGLADAPATIRLLCIHQAVEGATVGPANYTFRYAADVVRGRDLPAGVAAVLAGHIHRHQVLETDLSGRPLPAPVLYPGSVERTAFAEIGEPKGVLLLELMPHGEGGRLDAWRFMELPTRPMVVADVAADGLRRADLEVALRQAIARAPEDAVLRLRITGHIGDGALPAISAARVRALAPRTMVVEVRIVDPAP
jgi:DNA repair exonuclease SbcCD nuclease subunit